MRKRSYPKKRKTYRPRTRRPRRGMGGAQRVFTEVLDAGTLNANTGGIFAPSINSIPQIVNYTTLYTEYCIKKIEVLLVPLFGAAEENSALYNSTVGIPNVGTPRLTFAVQESTDISLPATELDVLQMNGCKIRLMDKPTRLYSNRPVAALSQYAPGGFQEYAHTKAPVWLALSSPQVVPHMGLKYWISAYPGAVGPVLQAYYKITFAVRDPR